MVFSKHEKCITHGQLSKVLFIPFSLQESSDQLRYQLSLMQAKQALLNATNKELSSKTSADVTRILNEIQTSRDKLGVMINNAVDKLLQMEVECFTRVNLSMCEVIMEGHVAFKSLLQDLSEHFAQSEYLQSILNGRPQLLKVLQQTLSEIDTEMKALQVRIASTGKAEAAEEINSNTRIDTETVSCPEVGQMNFAFRSDEVDTSEVCDEDSDEEICMHVEVPINATKRNLWNVESCFVDNDLVAFGTYDSFVTMMNSISMKVSASLLKVGVQRSWFDESLFEESEHYTMVSETCYK